MSNIGEKVEYVLSKTKQSGNHHCHWPGCERLVPPAKWGCTKHWYMLPQHLRNKIWYSFRPGQEISKTPSREYVKVAQEIQEWIKARQ